MHNLFEMPVSSLSGVGKVKAQAYANASVFSLYDLLYYFPRAYEDRTNIKLLRDTSPDGKSAPSVSIPPSSCTS